MLRHAATSKFQQMIRIHGHVGLDWGHMGSFRDANNGLRAMLYITSHIAQKGKETSFYIAIGVGEKRKEKKTT